MILTVYYKANTMTRMQQGYRISAVDVRSCKKLCGHSVQSKANDRLSEVVESSQRNTVDNQEVCLNDSSNYSKSVFRQVSTGYYPFTVLSTLLHLLVTSKFISISTFFLFSTFILLSLSFYFPVRNPLLQIIPTNIWPVQGVFSFHSYKVLRSFLSCPFQQFIISQPVRPIYLLRSSS